jgi:hypothetical protein
MLRNRGPTDKNLQLQKHQAKVTQNECCHFFNKVSETKQLTPKYFSIKINDQLYDYMNINQHDALFIFSLLSRHTSTCFGRISSP